MRSSFESSSGGRLRVALKVVLKLRDVNTSVSSKYHGLSQTIAIERHGWRGRRRAMTVDDNTSCRHTTGHRRHMIADDAKRQVETLSKENTS